MTRPIRVRLTKAADGWPKGAEVGYASEAAARKALGGDHFTVLAHTDTSEYAAPARTTDGPATETTETPTKGAKD